MEVSAAQASESTSQSDPIGAFPTSGQPVSDTMLKDMLLSLRSFLHANMLSCIHQFKAEIQGLGDRVTRV